MSSTTLFLARYLGLYCAVIALAKLVRRRETTKVLSAMLADPGLIIIAGVIALAAGLAVILAHNVWSGGAVTIAVTLLGWVIAAKGAWLLLTPQLSLRAAYARLGVERFFKLYLGVTLVMGVGLAVAGFWGAR